MRNALRILADDLTGACDVAAELLPWAGGVAVEPAPPGERSLEHDVPADCTWVRNTHSRTLPPERAAAAVKAALADVDPAWRGIVLKKIDTGLRGPMGAELDAAMDVLQLDEAFVLPAIPEVGRTTEGGRQLIGGIPVDRTPFGRDPQNPVADARVAVVIESTSRRRAASIGLDDVRSPERFVQTVDALRADGASIMVCDAAIEEDLLSATRGLLRRDRPLLLAGSIGLAGALRRVLAGERPSRPVLAEPPSRGRGILVIVGSAHPTAHVQVAAAVEARELETLVSLDLDAPERSAQAAVRALGAGQVVAIRAPEETTADSDAVLRAIARAAATTLARAQPMALLAVGGETAHAVLGGLGHPPLWIESRPYPLVVRSRLRAGRHAGLPLVTKGGSSGPPGLLGQLLRQLRGEGRR